MKKVLPLLLVAVIALAVGCKEKTTTEKVSDAVKDGAEAVKDGAKKTGEAIKEGAEKVGEKAKEVVK
jgi:hypothetical protein